ncbi:ATP-dependent Clp protease ATP-binding subunit [Mesomycoplasma ovipneumoniae]|uniref:ATP-dependent Clp protease ATP-binding subunit n=1 Tax=Mesomycoplasma ovipneumoniae TaxID=29562 RepID=UPI00296411AE|nr:AAA family ATPase [Mesomycoplasma ovipneumoniae]MDW2861902.1 AAA family ATPase [Mesomycoplasma ovipneumoniae]
MEIKLENLEKYARNLTKLAKENKIEPVIGRDSEIRRIIKILSRKTKNNPVLVGDPGVGKTAIVEGMALKIIAGQVPDNLKNKQIFELDLTSILAGASYKGEFERRIKAILTEIEQKSDELIIFIDEIHLLIGTGSSGSDSMDFANILKPIMARGGIKLIGATTNSEYRLYIEKDGALERRMQKVEVSEPSVVDTINILRGIKERFENFHQVKILDSALIFAAKMANRYIFDRFLPDKAIDLVDEAAASLKVEINYQPEKLEKAKRELINLKMMEINSTNSDNEDLKKQIIEVENQVDQMQKEWNDSRNLASKIANLSTKIEELKHKQNALMDQGDYQGASQIKYVKIPKIMEELENLKEKQIEFSNVLDENHIAKVVSNWTKIPIGKLLESESQKYINLEENLRKVIKGQNQALKSVSEAILRFKAKINDEQRPIASFLFVGPTGVGKTEVARALAQNLFDNKNQIIRLDMSEYMEKHSVSKLIGAPPGYIGFEQGGILTNKIRQNPYSIVLVDEIEKAHPEVINIFLQILDNGELVDSKSIKVNFRNTIIILTSNIGANKILEGKKIDESNIKNELLMYLKPEFINRIDEIIVFNPLNQEVISEIIHLELDIFKQRLLENNFEIDFNDSVIDWIIQSGYDKNFGARPIKRFIKKNIESFIAQKIVTKEITENSKYRLSYKQNNLYLEKEK